MSAEATTSRAEPITATDLWIDGKPHPGQGPGLESFNPATEELLATVPGASATQVEAAILAARRAFDDGPWPKMSGAERGAILHRLADEFERAFDQLAARIVEEVGSPIALAEQLQVGITLSTLRWNAEAAAIDRTEDLGPAEAPPSASIVAHRPVGVVSAITGYNYPYNLAMFKVGPALAVGCTTVVVGSPRTPLSSLALGEMAACADLPPGIFNVVVAGLEESRMATEHPAIDKVSFTGSVPVGAAIMGQAAAGLKEVVLELGGKSANIIGEGYPLAENMPAIHMRYTRNAGQGCAALTRILVHESQIDEFCQASSDYYDQIKVGDPWDRDTIVGPLIRPEHRDRVEGYVEGALAEGGRIVCGGGRPDIDRGWYVNPAVVTDVDPHSRIAQEEIFGPIAVLLPYRDIDEAIAIANDTDFGLAACVFTDDREGGIELAGRLRAGTVWINGGGGMRPDAPFGGFKKSGVGREFGELGLREFLEPQHVQWAL